MIQTKIVFQKGGKKSIDSVLFDADETVHKQKVTAKGGRKVGKII